MRQSEREHRGRLNLTLVSGFNDVVCAVCCGILRETLWIPEQDRFSVKMELCVVWKEEEDKIVWKIETHTRRWVRRGWIQKLKESWWPSKICLTSFWASFIAKRDLNKFSFRSKSGRTERVRSLLEQSRQRNRCSSDWRAEHGNPILYPLYTLTGNYMVEKHFSFFLPSSSGLSSRRDKWNLSIHMCVYYGNRTARQLAWAGSSLSIELLMKCLRLLL